ncbi:MAG: hypothetical protein FJX76_14270 [Armatimonadetes bacterium]|nr:hypothetical protein [Armatimonadota bacterium]
MTSRHPARVALLLICAFLVAAPAWANYFRITAPAGWEREDDEDGVVGYWSPDRMAAIELDPEQTVAANSLGPGFMEGYMDGAFRRLMGSMTDGRILQDTGTRVAPSGNLELARRAFVVQYPNGITALVNMIVLRSETHILSTRYVALSAQAYDQYLPVLTQFFSNLDNNLDVASANKPQQPTHAAHASADPCYCPCDEPRQPTAKPSPIKPVQTAPVTPSKPATPTQPAKPANRPQRVSAQTPARPSEPPSIRITSPGTAADDSRDLVVQGVSDSSATIVGYAYGPNPIAAVKIKDREVAIAPAGPSDAPVREGKRNVVKFSAPVRLGLGKNQIALTVEDVEGGSGARTITLERKEGQVAVAPPQAQPQAQPQPGPNDIRAAKKGNRYALLVGISKYQHRDITQLRMTLNDITAIQKALADPKVGGYKAENIRVLRDDAGPDAQPNKVNIEKAMNWLTAMASTPEDTVFIYFSGHGTNDQRGSYLLTVESDPDALLSTAMNVTTFNQLVKDIPARRKVIVLDACHSGGMSIAARHVNRLSQKMLEALAEKSEGEWRFLSCKETEQSFESDEPGVNQGVFSYYFVKGMRGEADGNNDRLVTQAELEDYVKGQVFKWAAMRGKRQTPHASGEITGVIIISQPKK